MLYCISAIMLLSLIILQPMKKDKINLIKAITLILICFFAYNTAVCYILNFINIPITLINLSIINFSISIALIIKIIRKKEIQKYKIEKRNIIVSLLLFVVVSICICINFRNLTRIRYMSMDAVQHYKAAREFSENTTLFDKAEENSTTSKSHMPMGYVNIGILFKIFRPWIGVISLYKIYIIFESIIYFLCGIIFYYCIEKILKTKNEFIIGLVFSIIYLIGYPLNSLISGFHYLIIGILYFTTILYVIKELIIEEKISFNYSLIILSLLNIGLIFSYALFCPPVYLAEFVYFIYKYKKDRNKKHLILFILLTLILTGLMGSDIIIYQRFKQLGSTGIELEGWIYKNDWSNIILFLPFVGYYLIKNIKKDNIFEKYLILFFIVFFILLAIGTYFKICSSYYFYKNSYILWLLVLYIALKAMIELINKGNIYRYAINVFTIFYVFLLSVSVILIDTYLISEGKAKEDFTKMMDIYTLNFTNMKLEHAFMSKEELEALEQLDNIIEGNWKKENNIFVMPNHTQILWTKALTGNEAEEYFDPMKEINNWNNNKYKYLLLLKTRPLYETIKQGLNLDMAQILYENNQATIYLRNGE